jgi:methyl-galactoside transport system substrate-binding protein
MNLIIDSNTSNLTITSFDSKNSQIIQNEIIEDALSKKYPLLIVNPVDRLGVYPIIEKAKQLDTPIIFINREPLKEDLDRWDKVYYVGAKAAQSAELQAEIVMDLFGGDPIQLNEFDLNHDNKIQMIILKGEPGHQDAEIRTDHVISVLTNAGYELDILSITDAYFSKDIAYEEMYDLLEDYKNEVEVVVSNNDAMAIGAVNALVEEGFFEDSNNDGKIDRDNEKWFPVVGIDGIPSAIDLIENGFLYGTVINDSQAMADAINDLMDAIINNKDINSLPYKVENGCYIWIDYKKYTSD